MATSNEDHSRGAEPEGAATPDEDSPEAGRSPPPMRVVGVGTSAGGLGALKTMFAGVPEQTGVCFVVVMHLSPDHESHLAPLLQSHCRLPVQQVSRTIPLEMDHVYVIPPGVNLDAIDTHLRLSRLEEDRQDRAAIDHFFRTLADAQQEHAVGVVLTGTGADGTAGLRRIRERGGLTVVQSPEEAEHDGMPRSAIAAGVADVVLPLGQIVAAILEMDRAAPRIAIADEEGTPPEKAGEGEGGERGRVGAEESREAREAEGTLREILARVRRHTGHDFAHYKRSTLLRRIRRRMQLHRLQSLDEYLRLLEEDEAEAGHLFEDLLITVTEFFRDPEVFAHLEEEVIPQLFEGKGPDDSVRAWSIGCATGEEAYSLVMLLLEEEARRETKPRQVQVFATDLHEPALRKARAGIYPATVEADVSPERLRQFFVKENGHYRTGKRVRERIVFALHNILQDPPFSHVELVTCRNLLIYLQRDVQRHLMSLVHYALEPDGLLLVGTAEGVDSELFVCENKQYGLYRRRSVPTPKLRAASFPPTSRRHPPAEEDEPAHHAEPTESYGVLHAQMVERYAPPSMLINPDGDLVHYTPGAGRYLRMAGGTPTSDVYHLLPEPLRLELRTAVHAARDGGRGYRSRPIALPIEGRQRRVILRAQPIEQPEMTGYFLVMFDELEDPPEAPPEGAPEESAGESAEATLQDERGRAEANTRQLEAELDQAKRRMQVLIEAHEDALERSQAYNEELESTNEELRSTMEELETSKEEMQSMNEELTTLNQENLQRVEELDSLSSDLHNLLTATHIATVFLDREGRILRFTPSMAELFSLRDTDHGRPLDDLSHAVAYEHLREDFQRVLDHLTPVEREVRGDEGRWYLTRLQCYRTGDDRIEGVVITFIDITERREAEEEVRTARELAEKVIDTVRNPMLVLGDDLRVRDTNDAFCHAFGKEPAEIRGRLVYELNGGQWDIPELRRLLENILPENETMEDFEIEHRFKQAGPRSLLLNARRIDHVQLILLAIEDVTERKQARQSLERSHGELERQVAERTAQLQRQAARLQQLVRELSTAEQRERKRIATVLHDDLQQLLASVKMQLNMTRGQTQDEAGARPLDRALSHLDEAIDATRTLVRQMVPKVLYEQGLVLALQWLGEEMARRHGLDVRIECEQAEPRLGDETKTLLFESVREMLFNIVKHAGVDRATVAVRQDRERLHVTVSDEGAGFDVDAKAEQEGKSDFGVFSRGDRIEALGGSCSIDSTPGRGTRVHVHLPLETTAAEEAEDEPTEPVAPVTLRVDDTAVETERVRVLVVDDHTLVRNGIVAILEEDPRLSVIGDVGDGLQAIAAIEQHRPDVVLMDVNMPRMNGIEATREICRRWPDTLVVGLSMQDRSEPAARAMVDAGVSAFLSKSEDAEKMIDTILHLIQNQT